MKRVLILLLMLIMICPSAMKAEGNTITIINCDKVNIRNEAGQSLGRVGCYTPVTVGETNGDSTYIIASRAFIELSENNYGYAEYVNKHSGDISGWVKTRCLSEVNEDMDQVIHKAEEYRWEFWVDGIYHELRANGISKNKCYETHNVPTVNGIPLDVHVRPYDVSRKGSAYSASEGWREAYYHFIVEEGFRSGVVNDSNKDAYSKNRYSLYDITLDGIPELIMDTSWNDMVENARVFYTYKAGEVEYLCNDSWHGYYYTLNNNKYPGLVCPYGRQRAYWVAYLTFNKDSQQLEVEDILYYLFEIIDDETKELVSIDRTKDDGLYQAWLDAGEEKGIKEIYTFTRYDMPELSGWDAFLKSHGY